MSCAPSLHKNIDMICIYLQLNFVLDKLSRGQELDSGLDVLRQLDVVVGLPLDLEDHLAHLRIKRVVDEVEFAAVLLIVFPRQIDGVVSAGEEQGWKKNQFHDDSFHSS